MATLTVAPPKAGPPPPVASLAPTRKARPALIAAFAFAIIPVRKVR